MPHQVLAHHSSLSRASGLSLPSDSTVPGHTNSGVQILTVPPAVWQQGRRLGWLGQLSPKVPDRSREEPVFQPVGNWGPASVQQGRL